MTDWQDIGDNYALAVVFFEGQGNTLFANMKDYDMLMLKLKYLY